VFDTILEFDSKSNHDPAPSAPYESLLP
jgi:hypothetical protein